MVCGNKTYDSIRVHWGGELKGEGDKTQWSPLILES